MSDSKAIVTQDRDGVTSIQPVEPNMLDLFREALTSDVVTPEKLEKLVDLKLKMDAVAARRDFAAALAAFQGECKPIAKTHELEHMATTRNGVRRAVTYAPLEVVERHIRPTLAKHSLSYTFDQTLAGGNIVISCTVRHIGGHEVTTSFTGETAMKGNATAIQKIGAADTYAKRRCLSNALGLMFGDEVDTDGADPAESTTVDRLRLADFKDALEAKYPDPDKLTRNITKIVDHYGVRTLADLTTAQVEEVTGMLS